MISVIIPAHDEAGWIGACLGALARSEGVEDAEVIVVANGCADATADLARAEAAALAAAGFALRVLELPALGKPGALNAGDAAARFPVKAWLDADVTVSPGLIAGIAAALAVPEARLASGRPEVAQAKSLLTRAYARFWTRLPFMAPGSCPAFGLYAMNEAGRARLGEGFPAIISDDTFVRLQFTPEERIEVAESYQWPMVEGFSRLVKVRRRQDQGVAEIAARWPELMGNEGKASPSKGWLVKRLLADPPAFLAYAAVTLAVRLGMGAQSGWVRGR